MNYSFLPGMVCIGHLPFVMKAYLQSFQFFVFIFNMLHAAQSELGAAVISKNSKSFLIFNYVGTILLLFYCGKSVSCIRDRQTSAWPAPRPSSTDFQTQRRKRYEHAMHTDTRALTDNGQFPNNQPAIEIADDAERR